MGDTKMDRRHFLGCIACAAAGSLIGCTAGLFGRKGDGMSTEHSSVDPEQLSYCGFDCKGCGVFKVTVHGDEEALQEVLPLWEKTAQTHWGMEKLDPAILRCTGCRVEGDDIFRGCRDCPIRRCCREKGLTSCALCPDWRECTRLAELFRNEPQARDNLDAMAQSPGS